MKDNSGLQRRTTLAYSEGQGRKTLAYLKTQAYLNTENDNSAYQNTEKDNSSLPEYREGQL